MNARALATALASLSLAATAEEGATASGSSGASTALQNHGVLGLALGRIGGGEDFYFTTTANFELNLGPVGLGLTAPLSFLAYEFEEPGRRAEKTYFNLLRRSDWDEFSDFGKIIRYVRLGHKREPLYLQAGELWGASIGHGTMVNRYTNGLLVNNKRLGVAFDVNTSYGGVETLTDNLLGPSLLGIRGYIKPLAFGDPEGFFAKRLAVGATFITDRTAPRAFKMVDANGDGVQEVAVSEETLLAEPAYGAMQSGVGVDLELVVLESSILDIIPYTDLNRLLGGGGGFHAGVLFDFEFPLALKLNLSTRLEYRALQAGYLPVYFDNFYDLQRFNYTVTLKDREELVPKSVALRRLRDQGEGLQGVYGEAAADLMGWVQVGLIYEDYEGDLNSAIGSYAALPAFESVQLSASYFRKGFEGMKDAIKLDEKSILMGSVRFNVWGPIFVTGTFRRFWQTVADPAPVRVIAKNDWNFGADIDLKLPSFF